MTRDPHANFFWLALIAVTTAFTSIAEGQEKYLPHIDVGGYYFTYAPHDAAFTGFYLPLAQDPTNLLYADIRGIFKGNAGHTKEGNFGLSYRHLDIFKDRMYGVYGFWDRKQTTTLNYFSQGTFGVESWFNRLFAGANFYLPVGKHSVTQTSTATSGALTSIGTGSFNIIISQSNSSSSEVALVGGDMSVGYQIIDPFIGYFGGYYYHSSVSSIKVPTVLGAMLHVRYSLFKKDGRLMLGVFEQITLEGQLQYDKVGGTRCYGGARFSVGVGPAKLSRMERHMTEQSLRDIDLVVATATVTTTTQTLAKNAAGQPIQVNQVSTTTAFNNAVGNSSVDIIAVEGVIPNANAAGTTLATGQRISGGTDVIDVNGVPVVVQVSTGGELQSASGSNLIKVGKDNTIRDITLTMINPPNVATDNRAIYTDTAVNDLGALLVTNVTSNGNINMSRSGASQKVTVVVSNSSFIAPSTWNPPSIPTVADFFADNGSNIVATVTNSTFKTTASTQSVIATRFATDHSSTLSIVEVTGCNIIGTDAGLVISATRGSTTTLIGNLSANTISGGTTAPGQSNEVAMQVFVFSTPTPTVNLNGIIQNNAMYSINDRTLELINFSGGGSPGIINSQGIINNTLTATGSDGINIDASTGGTFSVNNVYGNKITEGSTSKGFVINGAGTTVNVGQGNTGLSSANNNATVSTSGGAVVNPGV